MTQTTQISECEAKMDPRQAAPELVRVERVRPEPAGAVTIEIRRPESRRRRPFQAGQFNMVYAPGIGEAALSIVTASTTTGVITHTVEPAGRTTDALARVRRGDWVGVRGPFGNGWPLAEIGSSPVLIIAQGIGLTALRAAVERLIERTEKGRVILLVLGVQNAGEWLYAAELMTWQEARQLELKTAGPPEQLMSRSGTISLAGLVDFRLLRAGATHVFLACEDKVLRQLTAKLMTAGVAPERIHLHVKRQIQCAAGWCGHCQMGPIEVCQEGPVLRWDQVSRYFSRAEV